MDNLDEEEKKNIAEKEVDVLIASGKYKVVDESIFDGLDKISLTNKTINDVCCVLDLYQEFFEELSSYPDDFQFKFLTNIKNANVIDTHSIMIDDSFIRSIYMEDNKKASVDYLIQSSGEPLTKSQFVSWHDISLDSKSYYKKSGLRDNNLKYVGKMVTNENGENERLIDYFPLNYTDIDRVLKKFLDYYNANLKVNISEYDALIWPIIYHGLLAALQFFKDGNTRYARLIQNVEMWRCLNKTKGYDLPLPLFYGTRQYACFRTDYRRLVSDIAKGVDGAWDNWIDFNLRRMQDAIFFNMNKLSSYAAMMRVEPKSVGNLHV